MGPSSSHFSTSGLIREMSLPVSTVIWQLLPSITPGVTRLSPSLELPADTFLKTLSRALLILAGLCPPSPAIGRFPAPFGQCWHLASLLISSSPWDSSFSHAPVVHSPSRSAASAVGTSVVASFVAHLHFEYAVPVLAASLLSGNPALVSGTLLLYWSPLTRSYSPSWLL